MNHIELENGVKLPVLGFGIHHLEPGSLCERTVITAIENGVRLLETSNGFKNEVSLGIGVKNCIKNNIIKREDILLSTKVESYYQGYSDTKECFKKSCENLDTDYIDIYQIRYPSWYSAEVETLFLDSYRAMEELYSENKIRVIGISNCSIKYIELLLKEAKIKPMINQLEINPYFQQKDVENFTKQNSIIVQTWASMRYGKACYDDNIIKLAQKYDRSPAQLILRWHIQHERLCMTRTTKEEHLIEDMNIFDFSLSKEDMDFLDSLDIENNQTWPPFGINV